MAQEVDLLVVAYILLVVKPGEESKVAKKLSAIKSVRDINVVYGEYDVIAKVEEKDMEALQNFLIKQIRSMDEIERTSTMISLK